SPLRRTPSAPSSPAKEPGDERNPWPAAPPRPGRWPPSRQPPPRPPGGAAVTALRGRLLVAGAAVGWSTSGLFTKVLCEDTPLGPDHPPTHPLQIAPLRVLFPGLLLTPLVRRRDLSSRPATAGTAVAFAAMNVTFISAMAEGSAAN